MFVLDDKFLIDHAVGKGLLKESERDILPLTPAPPNVAALAEVTRRLLGPSDLPLVAQEVCVQIIQHSCPTDWLHFIIDDGFREHRVHQVRVALIGYWLLTRDEIWTDPAEDRSELIAAAWCACACHDHGYTLARLARAVPNLVRAGLFGSEQEREQRFNHLCGCYDGLFSRPLMHSFLDPDFGPDQIRQLAGRLVDDCPRIHSLDSAPAPYDHGLWSAINLWKRLSESGLPWGHLPDRTRALVGAMLQAVAVHHSQTLPADNRLAGVLVLADELQEWNRVMRGPGEQMVDIACRIEIEPASSGELSVRFKYSRGDLDRVHWSIDYFKQSKPRDLARLRKVRGLRRLAVDCGCY